MRESSSGRCVQLWGTAVVKGHTVMWEEDLSWVCVGGGSLWNPAPDRGLEASSASKSPGILFHLFDVVVVETRSPYLIHSWLA